MKDRVELGRYQNKLTSNSQEWFLAENALRNSVSQALLRKFTLYVPKDGHLSLFDSSIKLHGLKLT